MDIQEENDFISDNQSINTVKKLWRDSTRQVGLLDRIKHVIQEKKEVQKPKYLKFDFTDEQFLELNQTPHNDLSQLDTAALLSDLSSRYKVTVELVNTDAEFYSNRILERTITDKVHFISRESPLETYKVSETLIRQNNLRTELLHATRVKKTVAAAENFLDYINDIIDEQTKNTGKEPSMNKIAQILNDRNIESPSGNSKWYAETVKRILNRLVVNTNNSDSQDIETIARNSIVFVVQEEAEGPNRAEKVWEKLLDSLNACSPDVLNTTKVLAIMATNEQNPLLIKEQKILFRGVIDTLLKDPKIFKIASEIDSHLNDTLRVTFIMGVPNIN